MKSLLKFTFLLSILLSLSFSNNPEKKIIIIDAGHGGEDKGSVRNGIQEKDIVLDIAKKIKALNKDKNIEIILTRDQDNYPALVERSNFINSQKPNMVISLHMNSSQNNTERKGSEIYYQDNDTSKKLAESLAGSFNNCMTKNLNLHILRESASPTIMLELGFISNDDDRNYYSSDNGKTETAEKILSFIQKN